MTTTIFISYRHAAPTAGVAEKLFEALVPASEAWGADVFMDQHAVEPADLWDEKTIAALDRTTHFIVLLTNSYWSSAYCRKELARVVTRFEEDGSVLPLFVMVEKLDPDLFTFAKDRMSGRIVSDDPVIQKIGDVQFLGPINDQGQLVRLEWEHEARLSDQMFHLLQRLRRVVVKPAAGR